jgi:hypothetical protein
MTHLKSNIIIVLALATQYHKNDFHDLQGVAMRKTGSWWRQVPMIAFSDDR